MNRISSILLIVSALLIGSVFAQERDVVWSPLLDQQDMAILWFQIKTNKTISSEQNTEVADSCKSESDVERLIARSIEDAAKKGVTVIDIKYFGNDTTDWSVTGDARDYVKGKLWAGNVWLKMVDAYNRSVSTAERLKIRIRVDVDLQQYSWFLNRRSTQKWQDIWKYADDNKTYVETTTAPFLVEAKRYLNISDAKIRSDIGEYVGKILSELRDELNGLNNLGTDDVQDVSLALDAGNESGIYSDKDDYEFGYQYIKGNGLQVYFEEKRYDEMDDDEKVQFFIRRQNYLNETYKVFSNAVKSELPSTEPSVFYQVWVFDDMIRGAYELYDLLEGTGIERVYVTCNPADPYLESPGNPEYYKIFAFYKKTCDLLGVTFDQECSWAHYVINSQTGPSFNSDNFNDLAADQFYNQCHTAFKYGAQGMVYCNWTMSTMRMDHPKLTKENTWGTSDSWHKILGAGKYLYVYNLEGKLIKSSKQEFTDTHLWYSAGDNARNYPPFSSFPDLYITNPADLSVEEGLLITDTLLNAEKAVFISSFGRLDAIIHNNINQSYYAELMNVLGLDDEINSGSLGKRVDIITDGMIKNHSDWYKGYRDIYFPEVTSKVVSNVVMNKLKALPQIAKDNIRIQSGSSFDTFDDWKDDVTLYMEPATMIPVMQLLLD